MEYTCHYDSPLGGITIASDGTALTGLWFDGQKYFAQTLDPEHENKSLPVLEETCKWLDIYFDGKAPDYGRTMTYGEIADRIAAERGLRGMSAQAVGGAVGHNPISIIIPCHRVLGADGSLTGYAGGIDKKAKLLELEHITFLTK